MTTVLVLIVLLPTLSLGHAAPSTRAAWWGPTEMLDGWHVRIPLAVTNPSGSDLLDATVGHDLLLRDALLESGWTQAKRGSERLLQSFEMDAHAFRVVEYRSLGTGAPTDGIVIGEVASRARTGTFATTTTFDERTAPSAHVEWVAPGAFKAGSTRYFMIYADSKTNGEKEPANYTEARRAPLDARYWVGKGTTLFGMADGVTVIGTEDGTTVSVEAYQFGKPHLVESGSGASQGNPFSINMGQRVTMGVTDTPSPIRIRADKPVLAVGTQGTTGVIPSIDGRAIGTRFDFEASKFGYMMVVVDGTSTVIRNDKTLGAETYSLDPGTPVQLIDLSNWNGKRSETLIASKPIMVLSIPTAPGLAQLPSLHGAPIGSALVGLPVGAFDCIVGSESRVTCRSEPPCRSETVRYGTGDLVLGALDSTTFVRGRDVMSFGLRLPLTASGTVSETGQRIEPLRPWRTSVNLAGSCPLILHTSASSITDAMTGTGNLIGYAGAPSAGPLKLTTPAGGEGGTRFIAAWDVNVISLYDATRLNLRQASGTRDLPGSGIGDLTSVTATITDPVEIVANKPIIVLPAPSATLPGSYFVGLDASLIVARAGEPDHRGYLVSIHPAGGADEPLVGLAGPGTPLTYKLTVANLAKDSFGRPVADTIRLSLSPSLAGWNATISETTIPLEGGASKDIEVTVEPPADAKDGSQQSITVTADSAGNPRASDRLRLVTLVRAAYGVGIWFDQEDGPKTRTITSDKGETRTVRVIVKNVAPVPDRILVNAAAFSPDWLVGFGNADGPRLLEVPLDAGEARAFDVVVSAPSANASQSLMEVTATSLSDAAAEVKVSATVRLRADIRIALEVDNQTVEAPPGGEAMFRIRFLNRGADQTGIRFNATGVLPDGWAHPFTKQGEYVIDEISGIAPQTSVPLDLFVPVPLNATRSQRANLHFTIETIPQFVGDPILKESLDLLALVSPLHRLSPVDAPTVIPLDLDGRAVANLRLLNEGNGNESMRLVPRTLPVGTTTLLEPSGTIPMGGRGTLSLTLRFSAETRAGVYPVVADAVAEDGFSIPWAFNVTVPERKAAEILALTQTRSIVGVPGLARFEVRNIGNVALTMPPIFDAPPGWEAEWTGSAATLMPGASAFGTLEIRSPPDAPAGRHSIAPDAVWAHGRPIEWDLGTVILKGDVQPGQGRTVGVDIHNAGSGDATDVEVVLMQGGTTLDRVRLHRIPPEGQVSAILSGAEASSPSLYVRIDSDAKYSKPVDIEVSVDVASRAIPGPAYLATLALFALVGFALRRMRGKDL